MQLGVNINPTAKNVSVDFAWDISAFTGRLVAIHYSNGEVLGVGTEPGKVPGVYALQGANAESPWSVQRQFDLPAACTGATNFNVWDYLNNNFVLVTCDNHGYMYTQSTAWVLTGSATYGASVVKISDYADGPAGARVSARGALARSAVVDVRTAPPHSHEQLQSLLRIRMGRSASVSAVALLLLHRSLSLSLERESAVCVLGCLCGFTLLVGGPGA